MKKKYAIITSLALASVLMQGAAVPEEIEEIQVEQMVKLFPKDTISRKSSEKRYSCSLTQPIPLMESVKAGSMIKKIIPLGSSVKLKETLDSGWMYVEVEGEEGYISVADAFAVQENIPEVKSLLIEENLPVNETVFYTTQSVNLRAQPDKTSESLMKIQTGIHLFPQTEKEEWILVEHEGLLGWVNKGVLKSGQAWVIDGVIIVNKGYALSEDFSPGINPEAKEQLDEFVNNAKSSGHNIYPFSDFRTFARQETLFNNYVEEDGVEEAETYSARPGHSEHQTGLAFDIGVGGMYTSAEIGEHAGGVWMEGNAHRYGFVMSYPEHRTYITGYQYEPWHFRYVGTELAGILYENKQTLDEYFGTIQPHYTETSE